MIGGVSKQYDHVLIDSPPVLAVTDAVVGRLAGASLLVVKAGANPDAEIEVSVKRLRQRPASIFEGIVQ